MCRRKQVISESSSVFYQSFFIKLLWIVQNIQNRFCMDKSIGLALHETIVHWNKLWDEIHTIPFMDMDDISFMLRSKVTSHSWPSFRTNPYMAVWHFITVIIYQITISLYFNWHQVAAKLSQAKPSLLPKVQLFLSVYHHRLITFNTRWFLKQKATFNLWFVIYTTSKLKLR